MSDQSILRPVYALYPALRRASSRALSVYMPARAEGFDLRQYDIELGQLRRRYKDRLDDEERELMERELLRLRERLEVVKPAGCPAIAGFADEPVGLLELINLPFETEARLEVGPLLVAPIERELERFPPALIAAADKEQAKLFAAVLAELHPLEELEGVEVKRNRGGGTSAPSNQRKADNRAKSNLERVAQAVAREMQKGGYTRLFIAGPEEARVELERLLTPALRGVLAGHLSASLSSPHLQHDLRQQLEVARTF